MNKDLRAFRQFASDVIVLNESDTDSASKRAKLTDLAAEARWLLDRTARKAPKKNLPATVKSTKPARKAAHHQGTRQLRMAVFARAENACEMPGCARLQATEFHHLEFGHGRRREKQAIDNCMALCGDHHAAYHANPRDYDSQIRSWSEINGYPIPTRHA